MLLLILITLTLLLVLTSIAGIASIALPETSTMKLDEDDNNFLRRSAKESPNNIDNPLIHN